VWLHLHNNAASLSPQLTGPVLAQAGEHPDGAAADAPRARPDRAADAPPPRSGAAPAPAPRRSRAEPAAHAPRASAAGDRGTGEREPGRRAGRERPAAVPEPAARERGPPAAERDASAPRAAAAAPRPRQPEADGVRASVRAAAREGSRGAASRPREEPGREAAQRDDAKADAAARGVREVEAARRAAVAAAAARQESSQRAAEAGAGDAGAATGAAAADAPAQGIDREAARRRLAAQLVRRSEGDLPPAALYRWQLPPMGLPHVPVLTMSSSCLRAATCRTDAFDALARHPE